MGLTIKRLLWGPGLSTQCVQTYGGFIAVATIMVIFFAGRQGFSQKDSDKGLPEDPNHCDSVCENEEPGAAAPSESAPSKPDTAAIAAKVAADEKLAARREATQRLHKAQGRPRSSTANLRSPKAHGPKRARISRPARKIPLSHLAAKIKRDQAEIQLEQADVRCKREKLGIRKKRCDLEQERLNRSIAVERENLDNKKKTLHHNETEFAIDERQVALIKDKNLRKQDRTKLDAKNQEAEYLRKKCALLKKQQEMADANDTSDIALAERKNLKRQIEDLDRKLANLRLYQKYLRR